MTEWQIIESDDFSSLSVAEVIRPASRWRWILWAAGVLVFLLVAGFMTLREQRLLGRSALREDLVAVIFEEEALRAMGSQNRAVEFMAPNMPQVWQQAYLQSFSNNRPESSTTSPQLTEFDFDGVCAVVTVAAGSQEQVRSYCLHEDQWRRSAVSRSEWGDQQAVITVSGVQIHFRARDQAFVETLAQDIEHLSTELGRAGLLPNQSGSTNFGLVGPLELFIEPQDLQPPLSADDVERIVINSPALVPFDDTLSNEEQVRLALAQALVQRVEGMNKASQSALPGRDYFLNAVQTVLAAKEILPAEGQTALLNSWRSELNQQWISPFFVDLLQPDDAVSAQQAQLAANLMLDYIYDTEKRETVGAWVLSLPEVDSWDSLFQGTFDRSMLEFEHHVALNHAGIDAASPRLSNTNSIVLNLPLAGALLHVDSLPLGDHRAYLDLSDQTSPLLVELPVEVNVRTPDGVYLPASCVPPGSTLEIDGEWLESQRRLRAARMFGQKITPLAIEPAPADTIVYLVTGEESDARNLMIEDIFSNTPAQPIASKVPIPQALVALRQDGTLQHLITLSSTLQLFPLPITAKESVHFIFKLDLPTCDRSWFIHYRPAEGITGYWLAPNNLAQWLWRSEMQDILFFVPRGAGRGFNVYQTTNTLALDPVSRSFTPSFYFGWNQEFGQSVSARPWFNTTYIDFFDLYSGSISRVQSYFQPLIAPQLSPDGTWLAYLRSRKDPLAPPHSLGMLNVATKEDRVLIQPREGEWIGPPIWSPYLDQTILAVMSGPISDNGRLRPGRLETVVPDQRQIYRIVLQADSTEQLAAPVFCADGSIIYRVDRDGQYQLRQKSAISRAFTLLTLDELFVPVACP